MFKFVNHRVGYERLDWEIPIFCCKPVDDLRVVRKTHRPR